MNSGTTLNNRYRLEKKIGEGGFAKVFLATDLELERQVAVKVLDQTWASDPEFVSRFRKEARAIAALDHPNILLIHDFGMVKNSVYLVMPYVSGGTFSARMKQGRLTLDEIRFYLEQISSALDYAHERNIVHRDIKPTNLLMRSDGRLVLTDFGLAKLLDNANIEAPTVVLGTVAYMAPEQFQGFVSAASDIYALGVMLYQMILGKLPYEGNTGEVLRGHLERKPIPLTGHPQMQQIDPAVCHALDQVIFKVLAKRPAERYPTCAALVYAYQQALRAGQPRLKQPAQDILEDATDFVPAKITPVQPANRPNPARITPPPANLPDATEVAPPGYWPVTPPTANPPARVEVTPPSPLWSLPAKPAPVAKPARPGEALPVPDATEVAPPRKINPVPPEDKTEVAPPKPRVAPVHPGEMDPTVFAPARQNPVQAPNFTPPRVAGDEEATQVAPPRPAPRLVLKSPARLSVTTEPDQGFRASFELTGDNLSLGREPDNNLCVPLAIISRHHALLQRLNTGPQGPHYKIVDRKSVNHLYFKGREIAEKVLENGDLLEIGVRGYGQYIVQITYHAPVYVLE